MISYQNFMQFFKMKKCEECIEMRYLFRKRIELLKINTERNLVILDQIYRDLC